MCIRDRYEYLKPYNFGSGKYTKNDLIKELTKKSQYKLPNKAWGFNPPADIEFYEPADYNFDWLRFFMGKKAPTYQADLSMSGGSNRTPVSYPHLDVYKRQVTY